MTSAKGTEDARMTLNNRVEDSSKVAVDVDTAKAALERLIGTAAAHGRDWKLVKSLVLTIAGFISEKGADVLFDASPAHPAGRMRPEYRAQVEAIIDSFSDDEAAYFLDISLRHVRRLAQNKHLHFFKVGRMRRYPTWQFDERTGVLPGLHDVVMAVPSAWEPARSYAFMATHEAGLMIHGEPISPHTWLAIGLDPATVVSLIEESEASDDT